MWFGRGGLMTAWAQVRDRIAARDARVLAGPGGAAGDAELVTAGQ
ncbi:hypothetical protein [Nonomuraea sp. B19D2]